MKLAHLKREIRKAKHHPFLYRPRWNAHEERLLVPKAFGDRVERDILATIDDEFGLQQPAQLDEFAEENAAMEMFVEERSERFVLGSREKVLEQLLAHVTATGGNGYVCLTGRPGSGKSALLAHLSQHSILSNESSTLPIRHFVGASPGSTDVRRTLRRLCHELKAGCPDITADIPDDPERLRVAFPHFLRQACMRQRVVILLDAVNQFDPASHSAGLHWLPEELPANARVILSALQGPPLENLRRRRPKPREIELKLLTAADGEAIIEQFRKRYRKKFEADQRAALLTKTDAGTPLYLLAALEELRTLGTYEEITRRIAELPPRTHELFAWILERLKNDDGFRDSSGQRVGRELVSRFAALLAASRYGLSQRELADLLDAGDPQGNVAALLHLLRPYLMRRGELVDFYHGQFRAAAMEDCLETDMQRNAAHGQLAHYFRDQADPGRKQRWQGDNPRALVELPFHLGAALQWKESIAMLSSLRFAIAKAKAGLGYDLIHNFDEVLGVPRIKDSDRVALAQLRELVWRQADLMSRFPALVQQQALLGLGRFAKLDPALATQAARLTDEARSAGLGPAEVSLPEFAAEQVGLTIDGHVDAIATTVHGVLVWLRGGRWFELGLDGAQITEGYGPAAPISNLAQGAGSLAAASAQFVLLWPSWPGGAPQPLRHTSTVQRIGWSADGSHLLVVGQGGAWWLYRRPERPGAWPVEASGAGTGRVVEAWIEADNTPAFVTADGRLRRAEGGDIPLLRGQIACAAWDTRRRDLLAVLADGSLSAITESGAVRWSTRLPGVARQLRVAEGPSAARLLAALNDGSLWTCDAATGAEVHIVPVSEQALVDVAVLPSGDWAVARDYIGGATLIALRPTETALTPRELPARGRMRALHWDEGAGALAGVDEGGMRFTVAQCGNDWIARALPAVRSPTGSCIFLADGRLVSVEAVLSNNAVHLNQQHGGRAQKVWPGLLALEQFRTLTAIAVSPDGAHGAFAVRRPSLGGASVYLFRTTPWKVLDRFEFRDREVCRIATANGLRRLLFGFTKPMEPPVLRTDEGMAQLPIDGVPKFEHFEAGEQRSLHDLAISGDGLRYIAIDRHGDLWQFDHPLDTSPAYRRVGTGILACDMSADGQLTAGLKGERYLEVLRLDQRNEPRRLCELLAPWKVEVFRLVDSRPILLLGGRAAVCAYSFSL